MTELNNKQLAMNNTKTEIRNTLEGKFRVTEAEEWISVLTDRRSKKIYNPTVCRKETTTQKDRMRWQRNVSDEGTR